MENIFNKFLEIMESFGKNKVEYVLIGGLAINLHGFTRNTKDIDLFIEPSQINVDNLRKSLYAVFEDEEVNEITFEELIKYPVIRYGSPSGILIDLISKLGEKFSYSDLGYEIKEIDGIKIRFANLETLYKLKEKTHREIDQMDLRFLKSKLDENAG